MEMSLSKIRPGQRGVVIQMDEGDLSRRLEEYGLIPGTHICCRCRSAWALALEVRGTVIALRGRDLQRIRVKCG